MSVNRDTMQVLPSSVNSLGTDLATLSAGQLGIFDPNGVAITAVTAAALQVKDFYIALGGSTGGPVRFSAGQKINSRSVNNYTVRSEEAAVPMITELTGLKPQCNTEYGIKLEFRNQEIYRMQGFNQFTKTYTVQSGACNTCEDCPEGDGQEIMEDFITQIEADESGLMTVERIVNNTGTLVYSGAPTLDASVYVTINGVKVEVPLVAADTTSTAAAKTAVAINNTFGAGYATASTATVTITAGVTKTTPDTITFVAGASDAAAAEGAALAVNVVTEAALALLPGVTPGLRITTVPLAVETYCSINLQYYGPRQTVVIPSLVAGFDSNAVFTETQAAVFQAGSGYDIRQLEYEAGGYNGEPGPYRASDVTGVAISGFNYLAVEAETYDVITLGYKSDADRTENAAHRADQSTIIAIPGSDTTASAALLAILDIILAPYGFDALADDLVAGTDVDDPDTDGIG